MNTVIDIVCSKKHFYNWTKLNVVILCITIPIALTKPTFIIAWGPTIIFLTLYLIQYYLFKSHRILVNNNFIYFYSPFNRVKSIHVTNIKDVSLLEEVRNMKVGYKLKIIKNEESKINKIEFNLNYFDRVEINEFLDYLDEQTK